MPYLGNGLTKFTTADDLTVSGDAAIDTTTLVVDSTNNRVGIGNASPSDALHIKTTADADIGLQVQNDDTQAFCKVQSGGTALYGGNGGVNFVSGGSFATRMGITSGGNVNIGTTTSTRSPLVIANSSSQISLTDADGSSNIVDIKKVSGPHLTFDINGGEKVRLLSDGNLLCGKTSSSTGLQGIEVDGPNGLLVVTRSGYPSGTFNRLSSDGAILDLRKDSTTVGSIGFQSSGFYIDGESGHEGIRFANGAITPRENGSDSDGASDLGASNNRFKDGYFSGILYGTNLRGQNDTDTGIDIGNTGSTADILTFITGGSEGARFNSSQTLLIGKTAEDFDTVGFQVKSSGQTCITRNQGTPLFINRKGDTGGLIDMRDDNTTVGTISFYGSSLAIGTGDTGLRFIASTNSIAPSDTGNQTDIDDTIDLGYSSRRFDDIYATNGTIQTSDENEKQNIATLTSAEITAAKAISKLFKTFKWKSKVTTKGDAARTHTGVIAQEVQAAMSAAGLDATKYAFWCSNTWTNDDGNEQTRMGVRYPELLAFVGAATEQRLADIETRLAALEAS